MKKYIVWPLLIGSLLSCKSTSDSRKSPYKGLIDVVNCFHIVNGQKTVAFPQVTLVLGLTASGRIADTCTGTFIGSKTVLTAAHCIATSTIGISRATELSPSADSEQAALSTFVPAVKVLNLDPQASRRQQWRREYSRNDVAILIFNQVVAPAVAPLLNRKGIPTEDVTLVGFGQDAVDPAKANRTISKRYGFNTLAIVPEGLSVVGPPENIGTQLQKNSTTASGDSGGPLFVAGMVGGVLSGGGPYSNSLDQSYYADLTASHVQSFIQTATQNGGDLGAAPGVGLVSGTDGVQSPDCLH